MKNLINKTHGILVLQINYIGMNGISGTTQPYSHGFSPSIYLEGFCLEIL